MAKKREAVTYNLKKGNEVVYKGTTNDPERREREHRKEGKKLDRLEKSSRKMTEEGAKKKEVKGLATYKRNHGGKGPRYNKDSDG